MNIESIGKFRSKEARRQRNLKNCLLVAERMAKTIGIPVAITGDIECANTIAIEYTRLTENIPQIVSMPKEIKTAKAVVISSFISSFKSPTIITTE